MSLPTTYTPALVSYDFAVEGDGGVPGIFTIALRVDPGGSFNEARVEAFLPGIEAGLQHLGEQLLSVSGVTAIRIYRSYQGVISGTDIFATP